MYLMNHEGAANNRTNHGGNVAAAQAAPLSLKTQLDLWCPVSRGSKLEATCTEQDNVEVWKMPAVGCMPQIHRQEPIPNDSNPCQNR